MNRRGFLAALAGAAVLDPERLLWTPGKLISIPPTMHYRIPPRMRYRFFTEWDEPQQRLMMRFDCLYGFVDLPVLPVTLEGADE